MAEEKAENETKEDSTTIKKVPSEDKGSKENHSDPGDTAETKDKRRTDPYYNADIMARLDLIEESIKPLMNFVATRYEEPKEEKRDHVQPKPKETTSIEEIKNLLL